MIRLASRNSYEWTHSLSQATSYAVSLGPAVIVMPSDDEIILLKWRVEPGAEDADLEEVYNSESDSFPAACTCGRDHPLAKPVDPALDFPDLGHNF